MRMTYMLHVTHGRWADAQCLLECLVPNATTWLPQQLFSCDVPCLCLAPESMSGDSRKDFLVTTIGNHFGYSTGDGAVSHIYDSKELNSFLDDGNCGVLGARVELTHDVKIVQVYSGSLPEMELQGERWLVVFRLRPVPITPDNLHSNILVSTMVETPLESLYHAVQKVYAPILLKDSKWSKVCIVD